MTDWPERPDAASLVTWVDNHGAKLPSDLRVGDAMALCTAERVGTWRVLSVDPLELEPIDALGELPPAEVQQQPHVDDQQLGDEQEVAGGDPEQVRLLHSPLARRHARPGGPVAESRWASVTPRPAPTE